VDVLPAPAPRAARVRASGELDLATAPRLQAKLEALLAGGCSDLDLDLEDVTFCDVAGLNMLLRVHAAAVAAGGLLVVRGSCPPLRLMLRVLRPEGAFELRPRDGEPAVGQA
jgi:anti-anti-sigma factor